MVFYWSSLSLKDQKKPLECKFPLWQLVLQSFFKPEIGMRCLLQLVFTKGLFFAFVSLLLVQHFVIVVLVT